jgi:sensor domain CHASE-containing protein
MQVKAIDSFWKTASKIVKIVRDPMLTSISDICRSGAHLVWSGALIQFDMILWECFTFAALDFDGFGTIAEYCLAAQEQKLAAQERHHTDESAHHATGVEDLTDGAEAAL